MVFVSHIEGFFHVKILVHSFYCFGLLCALNWRHYSAAIVAPLVLASREVCVYFPSIGIRASYWALLIIACLNDGGKYK